MKKLFLIIVLALITVPVIHGQNNTTRFFVACNYENITVDNTAGGVRFTAAIVNSTACLSGAASATFTIACASGTDCPIRMTLDGTAPTTSVGLRAIYGQSITMYSNVNLLRFRTIREGATSAVISVQYFN